MEAINSTRLYLPLKPTNMKQTEPIGFKGTAGNITFTEPMNFSGSLISMLMCGGKTIAQTRGCETGQDEEAEANAKLMAASKKMAIALQEFVEWAEQNAMWDKVGQSYYHAKDSLKKAGL